MYTPDFETPTKPAGPNWVGILGDVLRQLGGMQPLYTPIAERRREEQSAFERGEQQYQRRRADNIADSDTSYQHQLGLLDYKRLHPDDQLTQYMDAAGIPQDQRPNYYQKKVDALTAPPMMSAPGVDEQGNPVMRFFPRAQPVASGGTPSPAAVAHLKANPSLAPAFDQKYGTGSSSQYLGGPTQPASGGFR